MQGAGRCYHIVNPWGNVADFMENFDTKARGWLLPWPYANFWKKIERKKHQPDEFI